MKKSIKLIIFVSLLVVGTLATINIIDKFSLQTFSKYYSTARADTTIKIAVPIIENTVEELIVPLNSMVPGDTKIYTFSVTNFNEFNDITQTSMNYTILLENSNYLPLEYVLEKETNVAGTYETINLTNGLTPIFTLPHTTATTNNFRLIINWDVSDDVYTYANLVDPITIVINAEQKVS